MNKLFDVPNLVLARSLLWPTTKRELVGRDEPKLATIQPSRSQKEPEEQISRESIGKISARRRKKPLVRMRR
jgi:hypothetical protein